MVVASSVWKGQLTFGLVSLPVRLFRAARRERVRMHYVAPAEMSEPPGAPAPPTNLFTAARASDNPAHEDDGDRVYPQPSEPVERVHQTLLRHDGETPLKRQELLKAHEVAPNQYVTFTQQEMRSLRAETSSEMQIVRSVRLEAIDPVYFETSYYVLADKGGERAYALLFEALRETRLVALATVAMHGREHVIAIRPGGKGLLAHTMFYRDEIRAENEAEASTEALGPKELHLAKTFVEAIAGPFAPEEFTDKYREKLEQLIASRTVQPGIAAPAKASKAASAPIDIMEALRKSLEKVQTTNAAPPKKEPARVTRMEKRPRKRQA